MTEYETQKNNIKQELDNFILTDDLIALADAYLTIRRLLTNEEFPLEKYIEWLKTQNPQ